jgi:pepF/M3 family oligoendopeptidase
LESAEYAASFQAFVTECEQLAKHLDTAEALDLSQTAKVATTLESLITLYNKIQDRLRVLSAFVAGFVTVNSRDEFARSKESELDQALIPLSKAGTRLTSWIGSLDLDGLIQASALIKDHEFVLRKTQISAKHQMSPAEESLIAELTPTAATGWTRLHGNVTSQIEVDVELKGEAKRLPMSVIRTLAHDPDRFVRRAAYDAELAAWKQNKVPLAAALNGVKGTVGTLAHRRGWGEPLNEALFISNIDRETLDAMLTAAREALPDYRRYLKAKAKLLNIKQLAFFDLFAPLEGVEEAWDYQEAERFVATNFRSFSDKLGDFAERAFRENWIDAEPRPGKRDGAFCMGFVKEQSRIMMNFKPSFSSVKTLAHELGHGYHNLCLADRTPLQRRTPMTLAETASIFCETVIQNAAIQKASGPERLLLLEGSLDGTCQTSVDILSRFLFEGRVFEGRNKRELSATEFCDLMVQAQKDTYGDGLDPDFLHPYMWAVKPHYYSRSFYNFPYMYGMLFGLGLFSIYQQDPASFKVSYDDLLSSTGMDDAAALARRFGFDVTTPSFWRSSFDVIRSQISAFCSAAGAN